MKGYHPKSSAGRPTGCQKLRIKHGWNRGRRPNNRLEFACREENGHRGVKIRKSVIMNSRKAELKHEDYDVGWVCALPIEMAAATAVLDNIHPSLPGHTNDVNTYTLGNIGEHNIVIACLPSYGTNNAATVASDMRRSFPFARLGLMVGIGGGVPGQDDIRLGDVVVGKRVVQYDFGKTVPGCQLQRIGNLNRPPQVLLTAAAKLQADHASQPSKVPDILNTMFKKYPLMAEYARPSQPDRLFGGSHDHVDSMSNCNHCDETRLVKREKRNSKYPVIHYGSIASGNRVMKDAMTRDQIAKELDIQCFEMEAAGLMDHFPCLVIRGICDYSDSHKNKHWQGYAAVAAAAYAKELLSVVPRDISPKTNNTPPVDHAQAARGGSAQGGDAYGHMARGGNARGGNARGTASRGGDACGGDAYGDIFS
ncbi:hypothetical protein FAVG1_00413 [Fusarium avenaceum]|nr:hypothetical protein FAVG1_00413 [Fusarium avenaceum]